MKVEIKYIKAEQDEKIIIECVSMSPDFEDIRNYCLSKGKYLIGYTNINHQHQVYYDDIFYVEAVSENVFAYTQDNVFELKKRLYQAEEELRSYKFIRCSKSTLICLFKIECIEISKNGKYCAQMKNGEKIKISRNYVKSVKQSWNNL